MARYNTYEWLAQQTTLFMQDEWNVTRNPSNCILQQFKRMKYLHPDARNYTKFEQILRKLPADFRMILKSRIFESTSIDQFIQLFE